MKVLGLILLVTVQLSAASKIFKVNNQLKGFWIVACINAHHLHGFKKGHTYRVHVHGLFFW